MERRVGQGVGDEGFDARASAIAHGTPVRVVYLDEPRGPVFRSKVRRLDDDRIRLDLFGLPSSQLPPQRGARILLVMQNEAHYQAFDARVLQVEFTPPALVVSTPAEARRPELRRARRVSCAIALRVGAWSDSPRGEFPFEGTVVDLSTGGLQLHAADGVPTGATLRLAFPLSPEQPDVEVTGIVVGTTLDGGAGGRRVNVQFLGVDRPTLVRIARFVRATRRAERGRTRP